MMTEARRKVTAARVALVLDEPFFGALALRLALREMPEIPTACTNGTILGYSPEFVMGLTHAQLVGVVAHEVLHCAGGHPWRRSGRDPLRWNFAADYAINPVLKKAGFELPEGCLLDPQFDGKSAEWVYDRLPENPGEGSVMWGEVTDAPSDAAEKGSMYADWQQAVQQAANAAKQRGKLPAGLDRFAAEAGRTKVDWRSVLRRFVQQVARSDYSWTRPNRRYLARGLYLPALWSEEVGPIMAWVDTSGSIDQVTLDQFAAELRAIMDEVRPERVCVGYCDAKVHRIDTFERGDMIEINAVGGGGTSFVPAFHATEELDDPPVCVVYLTDMYGSFPDAAPEVPVLWVATSDVVAPFGETVRIET